MLNLLVRCLLRGKVLQMDCLRSENLKEVRAYSSARPYADRSGVSINRYWPRRLKQP